MIDGLAAIGVGFLLGSLPSGYLLVRALHGSDVRDVGSGNIGATNVGRVLGRPGWVATLLADAGKGALAVVLAGLLFPDSAWAPALAGFAAILGHCFTPWLGFRGGKGVATMLGTFLVLAPVATAGAAVLFALVATASRFVSLASLGAAVALPALAWLTGSRVAVVAVAAATAVLVLVRHSANIRRLREGTEARIGQRIA